MCFSCKAYFQRDTNLSFAEIIFNFASIQLSHKESSFQPMCVFRLRNLTDYKRQGHISPTFNNLSLRHFNRVCGIMFHGQVWLAWITLLLFLMFNPTTSQEVNFITFLYRQISMRLNLSKNKLQVSCFSLSKSDGQTVQLAS